MKITIIIQSLFLLIYILQNARLKKENKKAKGLLRPIGSLEEEMLWVER